MCIRKWPLSDGRRQIQAKGETIFVAYKLHRYFLKLEYAVEGIRHENNMLRRKFDFVRQ